VTADVRYPRDTAIVRPEPRPDAVRSLLCLSFCGGGPGAYHAWSARLVPSVELVLICYPGREGRFREPFAADWKQLAEDATGAVARAVAAHPERPYEVFGHSMGGWMAYDVVVRLEARGTRIPERLIVSSCNAPNRGVTDRDRFPRIEDTEERLLEWMEIVGALPAYAREDLDLREMAVELMKADIKVRDSYRPTANVMTSVPVHVLYGQDDVVIDPEVAAQWGQCTLSGARADVLPGGHFYTPQIWEEFPEHFMSVNFLTEERLR
jgi:surfactin synthase thioesterase subunit